MKISSSGTNNAAVKMLKRLDPILYQIPNPDSTSEEVKTLEDLCIDKVLESINMDTAFDIYQYADFLMCDRLKINVIKFLAINIVSLFERIFKPQVEQLPQHLWHDIENFIKNEASNKYCWQDFVELDNLPNSVENFGGYSDLPTEEECEEIFSCLNELYHSNEDVEANKALLQRTKEIKNWCRKLIKKIRNRKSTNTSEGKQITIKSESKIQQKKSEDDIFISDDDLDNDSDDILSNSSSDEENEEEKLEDKYEYYLKFYDHIQQFISEVIGDDIFQDYITGRKNSSENPFVFEVYQSSNARKILKKKKAKKPSVKETRKVSDATTKVSEKAKEIPIQETTKEQKLEMKAKIKELLPKDPPKPTISLEDPEYIYVEINGEYKYVKQEAEFKSKYKNSKAKDKKKRGIQNQWGVAEQSPSIAFEDIIKNEKQIEEEKKQKLIQEKEQKAEEELMRLAIEMSMKEYEQEEKEREELKKKEEEAKKAEQPKNALAKSLMSKGALNKYSKEGFVPKNLKKEVEISPAQENISENQYYDYGDEYDYNYYNRTQKQGGYKKPSRGRSYRQYY